MFIILIGPKGAGKSHIGRLLEAELGVHFFHVEPLWMAYHDDCRRLGKEVTIAEGMGRVHPYVREAIRKNEHVCVETTGASAEILDDLIALAAHDEMLLVRVHAPLAVCLRRIARRDPTHQIPLPEQDVEKIHAASAALELPFDITIENAGLTDNEILEVFREMLDVEC